MCQDQFRTHTHQVNSSDLARIAATAHCKQLPTSLETGCIVVTDDATEEQLVVKVDRGCVTVDDDVTGEQLTSLKGND